MNAKMLYFCTSWRYCPKNYKFTTKMKTKDKQDEAQRHAQRNYVINEVRNQLVTYQGCSFTDADILIGRIWGDIGVAVYISGREGGL